MTHPISTPCLIAGLLCAIGGMVRAADSPVMELPPGAPGRIEALNPGIYRVGSYGPLTDIPKALLGLPCVIMPRGNGAAPGAGYDIILNRPSAVYLAVHRRGQARLGSEWLPTGLELRWGQADDIYVRIVEPGRLSIPPHPGQGGGLFAIPSVAIVSEDLPAARKIVAEATETMNRRAAEVAHQRRLTAERLVIIPPKDIPGLVYLEGEPVAFLIAAAADEGKAVVKWSVKERDGPWGASGEVNIAATTPVAVALDPPHRGLFDIHVESILGGDPTRLDRCLAILMPPDPPSGNSPWGVMRVSGAASPEMEAANARRLGVSWLRYSIWDWGKVAAEAQPSTAIKLDASSHLPVLGAFRKQRIGIMGTIQMIPREVSSRPDDERRLGDAGSMYVRVKPRDWDEWEALVEQMAVQTRPFIGHWEIGNEPNTAGRYWAGTLEEFAEFFRHTAIGLRRGNPQCVILGSGFTLERDALPFLDGMLERGAGQWLQICTVHSLYGKPATVAEVRAILEKHRLGSLPLWSTEPKHVIPLRNFAQGIAVNTHFYHVVARAQAGFQSLAQHDLSPTPHGVLYAVGAKLIGDARYAGRLLADVPDIEAGLFQRGGEAIGVFLADEAVPGIKLTLRATPLDATSPVAVTDGQGRSRRLDLVDSLATIPLTGTFFVHKAASIAVERVDLPPTTPRDAGLWFEAESGGMTGAFFKRQREGVSGGAVAVLYGEPENPSVNRLDVPLRIDQEGIYKVYLKTTWDLPEHLGTLVSPFVWSIDGKESRPSVKDTPLVWAKSNPRHLMFGAVTAEGVDGELRGPMLHHLGDVRLSKGEHHFILAPTGPRTHDNKLSIEIDAIVLRPVADVRE